MGYKHFSKELFSGFFRNASSDDNRHQLSKTARLHLSGGAHLGLPTTGPISQLQWDRQQI